MKEVRSRVPPPQPGFGYEERKGRRAEHLVRTPTSKAGGLGHRCAAAEVD